jgi:hypothetical protein
VPLASGVPSPMDGKSCRDKKQGFFPGVLPSSESEGTWHNILMIPKSDARTQATSTFMMDIVVVDEPLLIGYKRFPKPCEEDDEHIHKNPNLYLPPLRVPYLRPYIFLFITHPFSRFSA